MDPLNTFSSTLASSAFCTRFRSMLARYTYVRPARTRFVRLGGIARQILHHLPYRACTSIPKHVHNSQLKRGDSFHALLRPSLEHNVFSFCLC
jgi:hypothetical protein